MQYSDPYSTHLPFLLNAVSKIKGPVLELGAGLYSTPEIRKLTDDVVTLETNADWITKFDGICKDNPIIHIPNFYNDVIPYTTKQWGVVFVDCDTAEQRTWITPLFTNVLCIVAHDTENSYWDDTISKFKYVKKWTNLTPNTSYLSNIFDINTI